MVQRGRGQLSRSAPVPQPATGWSEVRPGLWIGGHVRFGVFLVSGRFPGQADGDVLRRSVRAAELAEDAGFDDVWFAEHHFMPYGVCPSAITLAAHVLGRTSRIGVGTAVSVLSTTHPVALAEPGRDRGVAAGLRAAGGELHPLRPGGVRAKPRRGA